MNLVYITVIILLIICFWIYVFLSKKTIKTLNETCQSLQLTGQDIFKKYNVLNEQYRQLAKINQALVDVNKVKSSKKK